MRGSTGQGRSTLGEQVGMLAQPVLRRPSRRRAMAPLERHEEAAERFLLLSGGVFLLAGAGLVRGRVGAAARLAASAGALGLVAAGTLVGHSGGELVYRHGAAAAHATAVGATATRIGAGPDGREQLDD